MKKTLTVLFILGLSFYTQAQNGWSVYMMPGTVHKQLIPYAGEYKAVMSVWSGEGIQPESFDIRAVVSSIMEGRFLQINYDADMMGMKYNAISQIGFNNTTQKFTHIDFSSFGTGFTIYEGSWNEAQKVATLTGSTYDPETKKVIGLRETIKFIGADQIVFEVYDSRDGSKEFKSLEIILDRRK